MTEAASPYSQQGGLYSYSVTSNEVYFAAKEANDTATILLNKGRSFFNLLQSNTYLNRIRNMWYFYHGMFNTSAHEVGFTGEQGELVNLPVNHFRNIARHIHTMVTQNRPTMEAMAINTDYKSMSQTYLANGILEYYMRQKGLEDNLKDACEMAIVLGSSFIKMEWNAMGGDVYDVDPESGEPSFQGEIEFSTLSPLDVVVDGQKQSWDNEWILVRNFQNKYNLMARFPEVADKVRGVNPQYVNGLSRLTIFSNDDTDDIPVYEFFHKKTPAMPNGRYMLFVDADCILMDAPMPYREIPIFRIAPSNIMGTPYGYSDMYDVYPLQEAINALFGIIMTNQNAFGTQSIYVPRGADLVMASLEGGMNIIEGNAKPEPVQLTATAPETFKFLEYLVASAETVSGVNSVTRGNPDGQYKSGTAMALVQSMSLQFISNLQNAYVRLIEQTGTALIQILKDFSNTPKLITLVGKNNRPYLKEFVGDSIADIDRVTVNVGNPLSKTIAGRVSMAEQLAQMSLLKTPEQYFQVMNTGRLDVTFESEMDELMNIKKENESMLDGEMVQAYILDKHRQHILEHKGLISNLEIRQNPELLTVVHAHIKQHIDLLRNGDPDILQLIGEQPLNDPNAAGEPQLPPGPMGPGAQSSGGQTPPPSMQQELKKPGSTEKPKNAVMPEVPKPPAPFQDNPVTADQMSPQ